ncbi:MAG: hypothetical protein ACLPXU_14135 [Acidimicrobiales bacterium]
MNDKPVNSPSRLLGTWRDPEGVRSMDSARKPRFGQHPYLTEQPLSSSHSGTVLDIESSGDHQSSGFTRPFFKHGGWKLFLVLVLALGLTVSAIKDLSEIP